MRRLPIRHVLTHLGMVQGKTKGLQKKSPSSVRHTSRAAAGPKKGKRYVAPKKAAAIKQASAHKVAYPVCSTVDHNTRRFLQQLSSKINDSIERQALHAASSEKLTIMKNAASLTESINSSIFGCVHALLISLAAPHRNPQGRREGRCS